MKREAMPRTAHDVLPGSTFKAEHVKVILHSFTGTIIERYGNGFFKFRADNGVEFTAHEIELSPNFLHDTNFTIKRKTGVVSVARLPASYTPEPARPRARQGVMRPRREHIIQDSPLGSF